MVIVASIYRVDFVSVQWVRQRGQALSVIKEAIRSPRNLSLAFYKRGFAY